MAAQFAKNDRRHVPLEGTYNVRDLGGYPTKDGKRTRWGKYYRGDSIHALTETGQKQLAERGIRTVVDLRRPQEGSYRLHETVNIQYYNVSLVDPMENRLDRNETLVRLYCGILDNKQDRVALIMKQFAEAQDHPVLFHCKAGKDRTGIVAALLLDLAGVDPHIIAEDYALTARYIEPVRETWLKNRPAEHSEEEYMALLECRPNFMLDFLDHLYNTYQGAESYMRRIGLDRVEIEALKSNFREDVKL